MQLSYDEPTTGEQPEHVDTREPSGLALWVATLILIGTYLMAQILIAIPVISYWVRSGRIESAAAVQDFLFTDQGLWLTLIAAGLAAALTVTVALIWPRLWAALSSTIAFDLGQWFAWSPARRLRLWLVPFLTLAVAFLASGIITVLGGSPEVATQAALFSTPQLQIAATIIVSSIVPFAEELLFRGALYNALLPVPRQTQAGWGRHVFPVLVTSLVFAGVHTLAGFESAASLVLITMFALFLGVLRAVTGSIQTTVLSHAVWNMIGSLALTAADRLPAALPHF